MNRLPRLALLVVASALALAGCTQPTPAAAPTSTPAAKGTSDSSTDSGTDETAAKPAKGSGPACTPDQVQTAMRQGEALGHGVYGFSVVLTNTADTTCQLRGAADLDFRAPDSDSDSDDEVPIGTTPSADPGEAIDLAPGAQAAMTAQFPYDYLEDLPAGECVDAGFVVVTFGGDGIEAHRDGDWTLPGVCGPVELSAWKRV